MVFGRNTYKICLHQNQNLVEKKVKTKERKRKVTNRGKKKQWDHCDGVRKKDVGHLCRHWSQNLLCSFKVCSTSFCISLKWFAYTYKDPTSIWPHSLLILLDAWLNCICIYPTNWTILNKLTTTHSTHWRPHAPFQFMADLNGCTYLIKLIIEIIYSSN